MLIKDVKTGFMILIYYNIYDKTLWIDGWNKKYKRIDEDTFVRKWDGHYFKRCKDE